MELLSAVTGIQITPEYAVGCVIFGFAFVRIIRLFDGVV